MTCYIMFIIYFTNIRLQRYHSTPNGVTTGSLRYPANRNSVLTSYLPVFNPNQQNTLASGNRNQTNPCLLSHQSSGGEPCVCEAQTYKSASDRESVQYFVLDQDYIANSQVK